MQKTLLFLAVLFITAGSALAQKTITGTVTGPDDVPIPGVTIIVKGTVAGTISIADGTYSLEVPEQENTLLFSFVGMKTQEVEIGNRTLIDVKMEADVIGLEEVVAIGYGTVKKKDLTGAVTQVNAEKLEKESSSNMTDVLRGAVPGLNVSFSSSAKGVSSASDMLIRGETSVRSDAADQRSANAPLIVVDGMIYNGDLADINPNDIQAFDILKDASSAAIYGSRASNGVIIITTKKGKVGKPMITASASVGVAVIAHTALDWMTGDQFLDWRIAGFENKERHQIDKPGYYRHPDDAGVDLQTWKEYDGSGSVADIDQIWLNRLGLYPLEIANYKSGYQENWKDILYQTGLRQDYNISLSGATSNVNYYWSMGYTNNEGIRYNEEFETYRSRMNLEAKVNDWLKVGTNTQFSVRDQSNVVASDNWGQVTPYSQMYERDAEGNFTDVLEYAPTGNISASRNPWLNLVHQDQVDKYTNLYSKLYAQLTLPYGFSFTSEFIPRFSWEEWYRHDSSEHPDWGKEGGIARRRHTKRFQWQLNNILKWNKTYGDHSFDFTFLQNAEKNLYWRSYMVRRQFQPSDVLGYHRMQAATEDVEISSNDTYSTADALMARLNYIYKGRYLFTGAWRRDGYSAFGQANPRANFGSAAFAWTVSEEDFFNVEWMDMFKLRLSYGDNGNRGVGTYDAMSSLATGKYVLQTDGTAGYVSQLYANRMANADLKWERTTAYNFGIDFSTFDGRLRGNIETYLMETTDLLIPRKLPSITGYSSVFSNLGQINNRGFELSLTSINIQKNDFEWNTNVAVSFNRNEIVSLYGDYDEDGNELDDPTNGWFIGHALDEIWNYKTDGIWQLDEAEEAAKYSRKPGDYKIIDQLTEDTDGDGVPDAPDGYYTNDDKVFQGYSRPPWRWNLRNDFSWRNWAASIKMYAYTGYKTANNHLRNNDVFYDRGSSFNVPYWTPENPNNKWASVESYESGFTVYENNSFLRIDNVSLSYNVPENLLERIQVDRCMISFVASNPYVFTSWSWMDPERNSTWGFTPSTYTLKLNLTL
ncbi:SusC/RagA family TonB-linked outer membrane protein [Draconibacterium mangrovi]|uniref:SusC/RagA family TonB-linked outer membrane protein n=1 Tax=Draconibacterium mangrovi TaxID=2697469 RepID=UPI001953A8FB|nr:SusC/RagA family TonB-linked outer membrane protein [Draconibacterium mangrovi]